MDISEKLSWSYKTSIESAYIITLKGHEHSNRLAMRCMDSCRSVGLPAKIAWAVDGTKGTIDYPEDGPLAEVTHDFLPKVMDHHLSTSEISCALSHYSLWNLCLKIDQPIIILEHDAIVVQRLSDHPLVGSIVYLGSSRQIQTGKVLPTPIHGSLNHNYHFMYQAHAYSIDPIVAKNMVSHVMKYGICESLDVMLRADIFPMAQFGIFAYETKDDTTITDRKKKVRLSDPDNIGPER